MAWQKRRNAIGDDLLKTGAEAFVFGEGDRDKETIRLLWRRHTDAQLVAQAIALWRLDKTYSPWWEEFWRDPSQMERYGFTNQDLAEALRRLRANEG